ncbi:MAG: POTRA domain-containing protein, partial [Gemmatimonadaceae bacterium]
MFLCLAAVSGPLAPVPASAQDEEKKPEVVDLKFQGVKSLKVDELRESIVTDESHCESFALRPICWFNKSKLFYERRYLDRDELIRDMLRLRVFYWKRGFRETQVDTVIAPRDRDKVAVTFVVD